MRNPRADSPQRRAGRSARDTDATPSLDMDAWIIAAVVMLLAWAGLTFASDAPGWVHLLLTAGVFVLIWRIVVRGTPGGPRDTGTTPPSKR